MASQIQGLKKAAAANRNKTKSQLRDSQPGGSAMGTATSGALNNSVVVQ